MKIILVRYGELTLKGKNRNEFERALYNNIRKQLDHLDLEFYKDRNRIYVQIENLEEFPQVENILKIIPGIHSFSIADICETELSIIKDVALKNFKKKTPEFKVETKRIYKKFPLISQEVSSEIGAHILIQNDGLEGMCVNVHNPKQVLNIEIHQDRTFVFHEHVKGMGGLPIGTAGKALILLSGGIDSPVAAVLAMKRGLKINCIHFSSPPYTNEKSLQKVKDLVAILHKYDKDIKLFNVNFTELQLAIHDKCWDRYEVILLRRMMLRQAKKLAHTIKAEVLITGESLGQVASQTIKSMAATSDAIDLLILRPLITMDKSEIVTIAKQIGSYETSILPFDDCCVLFLPKSPSTAPKIKHLIEEETKLDFDYFLNKNQIDILTYDIINKEISFIKEYI